MNTMDMDTGDSYNFSGWIIGGHDNNYKGTHQQVTTDSKQQQPMKWGEMTPHPAGALSYAYSYTPYQYQYPPSAYPYGYTPYQYQYPKMANGGYYGGGYHGQPSYPRPFVPQQGGGKHISQHHYCEHMKMGLPGTCTATRTPTYGHDQHATTAAVYCPWRAPA